MNYLIHRRFCSINDKERERITLDKNHHRMTFVIYNKTDYVREDEVTKLENLYGTLVSSQSNDISDVLISLYTSFLLLFVIL